MRSHTDVKRILLLAGLVAIWGCDSTEPAPKTLLLAGTYSLTVEGYGTFEGEAAGFYHPPGARLTGLSNVGPARYPLLTEETQERISMSMTTNTFSRGRYRIAANTVEMDSLGTTCGSSALFEPGAVLFGVTVYTAGLARCFPSDVTGTVDIVSASESDVRVEFAVEAVPYGRADTLSVRGRYALRSVGPLPVGLSATQPKWAGRAGRGQAPPLLVGVGTP
ncbi:MAG TPA: hypothetical protein VF594_03975 [Rubricoccaceae bacterium]|jgi:hypothetical protein